VLRDTALRDTHVAPDPAGVALLFGGRGSGAELAEALAYRRQVLTAMLERLRSEHDRMAAQLDARAAAVFRRGEYLLAAERDWPTETEKLLRTRQAPKQQVQPESQGSQPAADRRPNWPPATAARSRPAPPRAGSSRPPNIPPG
jgi:hypothetical protein